MNNNFLEAKYQEISKIMGTDQFIFAGGCVDSAIRDEYVNDFDCFFIDGVEYQKAMDSLFSNDFVHKKERKNSNLFENSEGLKIDIVFVESLKFKNVVTSFDFIHSCNWFDGKVLHSYKDSFNFSKKKILEINTITLPWYSAMRAAKFYKKGFFIADEVKLELFDYQLKAPWGFIKESEYLDLKNKGE